MVQFKAKGPRRKVQIDKHGGDMEKTKTKWYEVKLSNGKKIGWTRLIFGWSPVVTEVGYKNL